MTYRLFIWFFLLSVSGFSQVLDTTVILISDTVFLNGRMSIAYDKAYGGFKDRLPDGVYLVVDNVKDKNVLFSGQFVDSLRNGEFKTYSNCEDKGYVLTMIYNYKKGVLDGVFIARNCKNVIYEGFYKRGLKHGYFLNYDHTSGVLKGIDLYIEDKLMYFSNVPTLSKVEVSNKYYVE